MGVRMETISLGPDSVSEGEGVILDLNSPEPAGSDEAVTSFEAFILTGELTAKAPVYVGVDHGWALVALFDALAEAWRGWEGVREWVSQEGELVLRFRHDGKGQV